MTSTWKPNKEQLEALDRFAGELPMFDCLVCGEPGYDRTCDRCRSHRLPAAPIMLVSLVIATCVPGRNQVPPNNP